MAVLLRCTMRSSASTKGTPQTSSPSHHLRITLFFFSLLFCRVDKSHFSMKYDIKEFMEAEFARRNLFKKIDKEKGK